MKYYRIIKSIGRMDKINIQMSGSYKWLTAHTQNAEAVTCIHVRAIGGSALLFLFYTVTHANDHLQRTHLQDLHAASNLKIT